MTDVNPNQAAVVAAAKAAGFRDPVAAAAIIPAEKSGTDAARAAACEELAESQPEMMGHARQLAAASTGREVRAAAAAVHQSSPEAVAVREWVRDLSGGVR